MDLCRHGLLAVLNARGRRHGDLCTTPTAGSERWGCAQHPRVSARRAGPIDLAGYDEENECSTPEGIGTETIHGRAHWQARVGQVLNAQGHRHGDQPPRRARDVHADAVLNARGHRHGEQGVGQRVRDGKPPVLNARGHRHGEQTQFNNTADPNGDQCSTPQSIGTEYRLLGGDAGGRTLPVLNALRHPHGEQGSYSIEPASSHGGAQRPGAWARRECLICRGKTPLDSC